MKVEKISLHKALTLEIKKFEFLKVDYGIEVSVDEGEKLDGVAAKSRKLVNAMLQNEVNDSFKRLGKDYRVNLV